MNKQCYVIIYILDGSHMRRPTTITSSLPLQILIYYNRYMLLAYFVVSCATFIYKSIELPYPTNLLGWEASALVVLLLLDGSRLIVGDKGNKLRRVSSMAVFLLLSIVVLIGNVYFLTWQTFVLRIDLVVHAMSIAFVGLEIILGIIATLTYASEK